MFEWFFILLFPVKFVFVFGQVLTWNTWFWRRKTIILFTEWKKREERKELLLPRERREMKEAEVQVFGWVFLFFLWFRIVEERRRRQSERDVFNKEGEERSNETEGRGAVIYVIEEVVEEHHHGLGPDTWGINSAARIVNGGKGRMLPKFWSHPRPRPRWQPNLVRHNWERELTP